MIAHLRDGELGMMKGTSLRFLSAQVEALMLMDAGPSDALESQLDYALSNVGPEHRDQAERFDAWVRGEAAKA